MLVDITMEITPGIISASPDTKELSGHIGTHFDVMDKEFPLEYSIRRGTAFDVSGITGRDIEVSDIDIEKLEKGMLVAFYSGYCEYTDYTSREYFKEHPQLSHELIDCLLSMGVSMIALDFAGLRRGAEHTPTDRKCADRGVFVVENLRELKSLCGKCFTVYTFPMKLSGVSGIPCRVIAEL